MPRVFVIYLCCFGALFFLASCMGRIQAYDNVGRMIAFHEGEGGTEVALGALIQTYLFSLWWIGAFSNVLSTIVLGSFAALAFWSGKFRQRFLKAPGFFVSLGVLFLFLGPLMSVAIYLGGYFALWYPPGQSDQLRIWVIVAIWICIAIMLCASPQYFKKINAILERSDESPT
jgi:hypothetical protein